MLIENRPFDTLKVGDSAELTRASSAEALLIFASATANHNPVHLPDEDGDGDGDGRPEAVPGNLLPGPGTLYRSQTLTFHRSARIALAAADCGADLSGIEVVEAKGEAAAQAVRKGHLHSEALRHPMLERARGLRSGWRFTHVFVMDVPGLATKAEIVRNATDLGISRPRVVVLSAVEAVIPAIPSPIDAGLQ